MINFHRKNDKSKVVTPLQRAITSVSWMMEYALTIRQIHRSPNLSRKPASEMLMNIINKQMFHRSCQRLIDTDQKVKFIRKLEKITAKDLEPQTSRAGLMGSDIDNAWIKSIHHQLMSLSDLIHDAMDSKAHQHFSLACQALASQANQGDIQDPTLALVPIQILMDGLKIKDQSYLADLIHDYFHLCTLTIHTANIRDYKTELKKDDTTLDDDNHVYFARLFAPVIHSLVHFEFNDDLKKCFDFSSKIIALISGTEYFSSPHISEPPPIPPPADTCLDNLKGSLQKLFHTWSIRRSHAGPSMPSGHQHGVCRAIENTLEALKEQEQWEIITSLKNKANLTSTNVLKEGCHPGDVLIAYSLVHQLGLMNHFIQFESIHTVEYMHQVLLCMKDVFAKANQAYDEKKAMRANLLIQTPAPIIFDNTQPSKDQTIIQAMTNLSINDKKEKLHI